MNAIFIIGIFLAFFFQFLLFSKRKKTASDKILGLWMFVIGIHLFSYYIYNLGYWEKYPHLVGITHPVPFLHGPLLYLYVVFSLRQEQRIRIKDLVHFIPAIAAYLYMLPYFFTYTASEKRLMDQGMSNDYHTFMMLSLAGFIISGIVYPILAYRLVEKSENLIHNNFSFDENISISWLRYCILGIGGVFATVAIFTTIENVMGIAVPFNPDFLYYSEIIFFIFFLGYRGIRHEGIFSEKSFISEKIPNPENEMKEKKNREYRKSGLRSDEAEILHQNLLKLMLGKKPYLEPKLTLNALADELDISVNYLSQIINQYEQKNFYDFVNLYRIDEFKARIVSTRNRHLNILGVAYDSGFNSKSSFNMVFKKHTGETPSQFMAKNI